MTRKSLVDEVYITKETAIELMDGARKLLGLEWLIWDNTANDNAEVLIERRDEIVAQFRPAYVDIEGRGHDQALVYVPTGVPAQLLVNPLMSDAYLVSPDNYHLEAARATSVIHLMGWWSEGDRPKPVSIASAYEPTTPVQAQNLKDFLKQLDIEMLE